MDYGITQDTRNVAHQAVSRFLGLRNVVACGLGYKVSRGEQSDELSLVVSVTHKVPAAQLATRDLIPKAFAGLRTDVVETGRIRAFAAPAIEEDPRIRRRPARPGLSIGHRDITAGTFELLVRKADIVFILSNNHVLADSNAGEVGDPIYQPGSADGGTAVDQIATLAEFEPLDFGNSQPECKVAETLARVLNLLAPPHRLQPPVDSGAKDVRAQPDGRGVGNAPASRLSFRTSWELAFLQDSLDLSSASRFRRWDGRRG